MPEIEEKDYPNTVYVVRVGGGFYAAKPFETPHKLKAVSKEAAVEEAQEMYGESVNVYVGEQKVPE